MAKSKNGWYTDKSNQKDNPSAAWQTVWWIEPDNNVHANFYVVKFKSHRYYYVCPFSRRWINPIFLDPKTDIGPFKTLVAAKAFYLLVHT